MAEDDKPPLTVISRAEGFRQSQSNSDFLWTAQTLRDEMAGQRHELADHAGQLKSIPALAAAVQQNFSIWFAVIGLLVAVVLGGLAFLGAYQVFNAQTLSGHSVQLTTQASAVARIEDDVREVGSTLNKVSQNVDALARDTQAERAKNIAPPEQ